MTEIRVRIDAEKTSQEFKDARKDIRRRTREGLVEGGQLAVLPRVRRGAPSIIASFLTIRAASGRAYVTTQGPRQADRITGLLNFGGTRRDVIRPKEKLALTIGTLAVRASVTKPRVYPGQHFLERDMEAALPELERVMLPTLMKAFDGLDHVP